jgi:hypothetical protein
MSRWRERGKVVTRHSGARIIAPESRPGYPDYTAILRWTIGAPVVRLSAASMIAFASMP